MVRSRCRQALRRTESDGATEVNSPAFWRREPETHFRWYCGAPTFWRAAERECRLGSETSAGLCYNRSAIVSFVARPYPFDIKARHGFDTNGFAAPKGRWERRDALISTSSQQEALMDPNADCNS